MSQKLHNATSLYLEGIRDGNIRQAVTTYTGRRYTQHSTGVRNGVEGFVEFFESFVQRCPDRDIRIIRSVVDGQYVFLQVFQNINNGEAKWVTTDLFDTDEQHHIIEHWDVISAFEERPSGEPDQISGVIESERADRTEDNKEVVRDFLCNVMTLGQTEQYDQYVNRALLSSHAASDVDALEHYIGSYDQVFKIIGQGDFVVAYSRVTHQQQELARFDIFRVRDGLIEEWWVNQEPVPPKSEWANGGKF